MEETGHRVLIADDAEAGRSLIAAELASESGIERLDETQWRVIRFLREFYGREGRAPMNRELRVGIGLSLVDLERTFPEGIKRGARRLAGLPNPTTCLD